MLIAINAVAVQVAFGICQMAYHGVGLRELRVSPFVLDQEPQHAVGIDARGAESYLESVYAVMRNAVGRKDERVVLLPAIDGRILIRVVEGARFATAECPTACDEYQHEEYGTGFGKIGFSILKKSHGFSCIEEVCKDSSLLQIRIIVAPNGLGVFGLRFFVAARRTFAFLLARFSVKAS